MIHGLNTGFLVAAAVTEHAEHLASRATLTRLLGAADKIAIAPQVLAEFIHIVTDPRRFTHPLDMAGPPASPPGTGGWPAVRIGDESCYFFRMWY